MTQQNDDECVGIAEAARILDVSPNTVRRLPLPFRKVSARRIVVTRGDLRRHIENSLRGSRRELEQLGSGF